MFVSSHWFWLNLYRFALYEPPREPVLASSRLAVTFWLSISWLCEHQLARTPFSCKASAKPGKLTNISAQHPVSPAPTPNHWSDRRDANSNVLEVVDHLAVTRSKNKCCMVLGVLCVFTGGPIVLVYIRSIQTIVTKKKRDLYSCFIMFYSYVLLREIEQNGTIICCNPSICLQRNS